MENLVLLVVVFVAGAFLYRFRGAIFGALRRFDDRNRAKARQEWDDRFDATAHYRHTLALAEESVEPVQESQGRDARLGTPVTRYVFLGEHFATREEAETARREQVIAGARRFYRELDEIRIGRQKKPESMR